MTINPSTIRRTVAATGVCLTGLMLTACQGAATTSHAVGAPAAPAAAAAAVGQGNASGSKASACTSSQLKASTAYKQAENSGHTLIAYIVLTNTSSATCTLDGYTGIDFLDPTGESLQMRTDRVAPSNAMPENTQTLAPGKAAAEEFSFTFAVNDQGNSCANAGTIAVIPPNQTKALDTQLTSVQTGVFPFFGVCDPTITVFPIGSADQIPS